VRPTDFEGTRDTVVPLARVVDIFLQQTESPEAGAYCSSVSGPDVSTPHVRSPTDLNEPFLSVIVKQPLEPLSPTSTPRNRTLIRNPILFGLGVMFLELAYEAPLRSLEKKVDVDLREERNTDYYIADRVHLAASTLLGGRYAEVARKCVHCDFGCGSDLNDVRLQEVFYREVVEELEELEVKLRAVYIGE
jgi:hypothetical protein